MGMFAEYEKALDNTGRIVRAIRSHHLGNETACAGWNVYDVVGHLIGTTLMYGAGGLSDGEVLASAEIGSDPGWTYALAAQTTVDRFSADGAMERTFRLPAGEVPGSVALGLALTEAAVHGWDIATASGKSGTIDSDIADALLQFHQSNAAPHWRLGPEAMFGPAVPVDTDASPSDQLVALLGRRPKVVVPSPGLPPSMR